MRKTQLKEEIAEIHRRAIRNVMAEHDLKVAPWCLKAGITEGALRNFLSGAVDSMGANTLELLARAAGISLGELLGEEVHYKADNNLMMHCVDSILKAAKTKKIKLTRAQEMTYSVMLYNHVIEYRRQGEIASPNEAMAALILQTANIN